MRAGASAVIIGNHFSTSALITMHAPPEVDVFYFLLCKIFKSKHEYSQKDADVLDIPIVFVKGEVKIIICFSFTL